MVLPPLPRWLELPPSVALLLEELHTCQPRVILPGHPGDLPLMLLKLAESIQLGDAPLRPAAAALVYWLTGHSELFDKIGRSAEPAPFEPTTQARMCAVAFYLGRAHGELLLLKSQYPKAPPARAIVSIVAPLARTLVKWVAQLEEQTAH